jgi:glycerate kinase
LLKLNKEYRGGIGMKIIIAPDSFKGSLDARCVANAIKEGVLRVFPRCEVELIPMADGGEGTVEALVSATGGRMVKTQVKGPLMEDIDSAFGILGEGETAVIEMASASGLPLVPPEKRNPLLTTTYGTGQLILEALDMGCRKFIIGIGGSATVDGGMGLAGALGIRFLDSEGNLLQQGGGSLGSLHRIDMKGLDPRVKESTFRVACDVDNPLYGERGAARVFGPQKGATPEMVEVLETNLKHLSRIAYKALGVDYASIPGAGAAGGLGFGLMAFLGASLGSGVQMVLEAVDFEERIRDAHLIITGEGSIDSQTLYGKTPLGVSRIARKYNIPVVAFAGGISGDISPLYSEGFSAVVSICSRPMGLEEAMRDARDLIVDAVERTMRLISIRI